MRYRQAAEGGHQDHQHRQANKEVQEQALGAAIDKQIAKQRARHSAIQNWQLIHPEANGPNTLQQKWRHLAKKAYDERESLRSLESEVDLLGSSEMQDTANGYDVVDIDTSEPILLNIQ